MKRCTCPRPQLCRGRLLSRSRGCGLPRHRLVPWNANYLQPSTAVWVVCVHGYTCGCVCACVCTQTCAYSVVCAQAGTGAPVCARGGTRVRDADTETNREREFNRAEECLPCSVCRVSRQTAVDRRRVLLHRPVLSLSGLSQGPLACCPVARWWTGRSFTSAHTWCLLSLPGTPGHAALGR